MIKEAIEYLLAEGKKHNPVHEVHADDKTRRVLLELDTDKRELHEFPNAPPAYSYQLQSPSELVRFIEAGPIPTSWRVLVMVTECSIEVDLTHEQHLRRTASVPFNPSPEYAALQKLIGRGVDQRTLWQLLVGELDGCLDVALATSIARLRLSRKSEAAQSIDVLGIVSSERGSMVQMQFVDEKGQPQAAQIGVDWVWTGRIWAGWDQAYKIALRLVVDSEDGLTFTFIPRRLDQVIERTIVDIETYLIERLPISGEKGPEISIHGGLITEL